MNTSTSPFVTGLLRPTKLQATEVAPGTYRTATKLNAGKWGYSFEDYRRAEVDGFITLSDVVISEEMNAVHLTYRVV